jgi:hypothetical protein
MVGSIFSLFALIFHTNHVVGVRGEVLCIATCAALGTKSCVTLYVKEKGCSFCCSLVHLVLSYLDALCADAKREDLELLQWPQSMSFYVPEWLLQDEQMRPEVKLELLFLPFSGFFIDFLRPLKPAS